jgi:hypothetical protein
MVKRLGSLWVLRFKKCSMLLHPYLCIQAYKVYRLALRYQLRCHERKINMEEAIIFESKQNRLQSLIDKFEHQADYIILPQDNTKLPKVTAIGDCSEFDDFSPMEQSAATGTRSVRSKNLDGSGMNRPDPQGLPILLPSTLGWNWCVSHGFKNLAAKEAELRIAQANESIHMIRLALGFKSAIFRTQVRSANSQQKKVRAWKNVKRVDATVHEHARIYSMARDAHEAIHHAFPEGAVFPKLIPDDLHVATLILGSEKTGQRNLQTSWIWGFGRTAEDEGTWMDDCKSCIAASKDISIIY